MKLCSCRCFTICLIAAMSFVLSGCGNIFPKPSAKEEPAAVYRIAFSQLPQEPVYNRVKKVHLPSVLPEELKGTTESASLPQVYELNLKNVTVEKAAAALAAVGGYDHYTASSVAEKPISLKALGTVDELGQVVAKQTNTHVVVDHINRQVRIVAKSE